MALALLFLILLFRILALTRKREGEMGRRGRGGRREKREGKEEPDQHGGDGQVVREDDNARGEQEGGAAQLQDRAFHRVRSQQHV